MLKWQPQESQALCYSAQGKPRGQAIHVIPCHMVAKHCFRPFQNHFPAPWNHRLSHTAMGRCHSWQERNYVQKLSMKRSWTLPSYSQYKIWDHTKNPKPSRCYRSIHTTDPHPFKLLPGTKWQHSKVGKIVIIKKPASNCTQPLI